MKLDLLGAVTRGFHPPGSQHAAGRLPLRDRNPFMCARSISGLSGVHRSNNAAPSPAGTIGLFTPTARALITTTSRSGLLTTGTQGTKRVSLSLFGLPWLDQPRRHSRRNVGGPRPACTGDPAPGGHDEHHAIRDTTARA